MTFCLLVNISMTCNDSILLLDKISTKARTNCFMLLFSLSLRKTVKFKKV